MKRTTTFGLVLLSLSSTAAAQEDSAAAPGAAPQEVYAPVTHLIFENLEIEGELVKPLIGAISETRRAEFAPMIRLRADFNAELTASVDDVK